MKYYVEFLVNPDTNYWGTYHGFYDSPEAAHNGANRMLVEETIYRIWQCQMLTSETFTAYGAGLEI